ncbi:MAG: hypothetical protein IT349_10550 [Candidatus Eisenbacteria bacterium]|nr:hypothetical protein [Candidatus Eisenbacteria bacterium]MCC7142529.1 hypothetical protein [Candidatus Eisenbacteria bacterium]
MSEEFANDAAPSGPPAREYREIGSKYEFVIAAAREAERLNDYYRNRAIQPDEKVTLEAVRRVREGRTQIAYEETPVVEEEARKESTYFFGS